jgi:hypothetical protein
MGSDGFASFTASKWAMIRLGQMREIGRHHQHAVAARLLRGVDLVDHLAGADRPGADDGGAAALAGGDGQPRQAQRVRQLQRPELAGAARRDHAGRARVEQAVDVGGEGLLVDGEVGRKGVVIAGIGPDQ